MASLIKAYENDSDRCNASTLLNLDRASTLFIERCDRADILVDDRHPAIPMMLIKQARHFHFNALKSQFLDMDVLVVAMKSCFATFEHRGALLRKWKPLGLLLVMSLWNYSFSSTCLENLIEKLIDIQSSLPQKYRHESTFSNKFLNPIKDAEACIPAYHKPSDSLLVVISDFRVSLVTLSRNDPLMDAPTQPSANFVYRCLVRGNASRTASGSKSGLSWNGKPCWVSGSSGCWPASLARKSRLLAYKEKRRIKQFLVTLEEEIGEDWRRGIRRHKSYWRHQHSLFSDLSCRSKL